MPDNPQRNYNPRHHAMLYFCSMTDIEYWNEWRRKHPNEPILLEYAKFKKGTNLRGVNLQKADLYRAQLQKTVLSRAQLQKALLFWAQLQKVDLSGAQLKETVLYEAQLRKAVLFGAQLQKAKLYGTQLQKADLSWAQLQKTVLSRAQLQKADLRTADLRGAHFYRADLQKARATFAVVDGQTFFEDCTIDENTDFTGVGLESARMHPRMRTALQDTVRKRQWRDWCEDKKRGRIERAIVKWFWTVSDYGSSTRRIWEKFLRLSIFFALIYFNFFLFDYVVRGLPGQQCGIVQDLFPPGFENYNALKLLIRAFYFSIVTMTTLGFGDMHANPGSWLGLGYFFLMFQVVLGYVLLGALVTRFAILFTGAGPAQDYHHESKEKQEDEDQ